MLEDAEGAGCWANGGPLTLDKQWGHSSVHVLRVGSCQTSGLRQSVRWGSECTCASVASLGCPLGVCISGWVCKTVCSYMDLTPSPYIVFWRLVLFHVFVFLSLHKR